MPKKFKIAYLWSDMNFYISLYVFKNENLYLEGPKTEVLTMAHLAEEIIS